MAEQKNPPRQDPEVEDEAVKALEEARAMPHGPERTKAMKRAGDLRNAADLRGIVYAKRGRPPRS
jgi:hypothetical protein